MPKNTEQENRLRFHYIKSNLFRTIHCDGAVGAISPRQPAIEVAFYSERIPIPQVTAHKFDMKTGQVSEEVETERVVRDGLVREVEVNIVLDIEGAERLVEWLNGKINEGKQAQLLRENAAKLIKDSAKGPSAKKSTLGSKSAKPKKRASK
jgi:hypothetical protein